ncbi:MAG: type I-B CRISPR-associated protein Cas5b [Bacteroidota bacterium]
MLKILAFDIWGSYAHYKKIFATTSALSYAIPSKTAIYGYIGAVIGLDKFDNQYLNSFQPDSCKIGLQVRRDIVMQRISTNLHPHTKGLIRKNQNRKPTTIEYVYAPKYRVYFWHKDTVIYEALKKHLVNHTAVYTPCLGLANLLSNFEFIDEYEVQGNKDISSSISVSSVIPRSYFKGFDFDAFGIENEIIEYSQYAVEMNTEREVTQRDDVFFDRKGQAIQAFVKQSYQLQNDNTKQHIILF